MARYIIVNALGKLMAPDFDGQVPPKHLGLLPKDTDIQDMELVNGKPVVNQAKLTARLAVEAQVKINAQAEAYLASTDWYIVREKDSGKPCPDEIKKLRQEARDRIVR